LQQATDLEGFLKNSELKYDAPWTQNQFLPANDRYYDRFKPEKYPFLRHSLAFQRELLKALFDAGVPLMSGTDATEVGPVAGFGLPKELEEFVHDGLTPYQALQTSTVNPARFFRQSSEFGTVEVGKRADLVLLTANPLADISNIHRISGVMVRGRWLDHAELSQMLEGVQLPTSAKSRSSSTISRRTRGAPTSICLNMIRSTVSPAPSFPTSLPTAA
jgi:adenine deaminase